MGPTYRTGGGGRRGGGGVLCDPESELRLEREQEKKRGKYNKWDGKKQNKKKKHESTIVQAGLSREHFVLLKNAAICFVLPAFTTFLPLPPKSTKRVSLFYSMQPTCVTSAASYVFPSLRLPALCTIRSYSIRRLDPS